MSQRRKWYRAARRVLLGILTVLVIGWVGLQDRTVSSLAVGGLLAAVQLVQDVRVVLDSEPLATVDRVGEPLGIALGPATGDLTPTSAVVWARTTGPARLVVQLEGEQADQTNFESTQPVSEATDYAGIVQLRGLRPDTRYTYLLRAVGTDGAVTNGVLGAFRTPPLDQRRPISVVFSGDLGGGHLCRRVDGGYRIFRAMADVRADFFLATGDMIYADNTCPAGRPDGGANVPGRFRDIDSHFVDWSDPAQVREVYRAHWRYNRGDPDHQALLATTPLYAIWDDHEVINNYGGSWTYWDEANRGRDGFSTLVREGREAFFAYAPRTRDPDDPNRLYRSYRWGPDLELFLLDTRSYRSRNDAVDTSEQPKTMLGAAQLAWLREGLLRSTATWKVVVSSVTLSVPSGGVATPVLGRDSWADGANGDDPAPGGFERELVGLLTALDQSRVQNLVFLTGDVHRALAIAYAVDLNGDGRRLRFHEFVAGPLAASPGSGRPRLDPTLHPSMLYGEGDLLNFGVLRIDPRPTGGATLSFETRDEDGEVRPGSQIVLEPER